MKTVPMEMQVVDASTGQVIGQRAVPWKLMPPPAAACQVCGKKHAPLLPHDATKLYYQYAFYGALGRWPTWADACAHCEPALTAAWKAQLIELGHKWTEPPKDHLPVRDLGPVTT